MSRNLIFVVISLVSVLCYAQSNAPEFSLSDISHGGITKAQAEKLLIIALEHQKYDLSLDGVFVDGDLEDKHGNPPHPGYYDFSLGYDTPNAGAIEYWGLFSVSSQTGDIWEINQCQRIKFHELQRIQREIMKKTGATFASEVVQRRGLGCTDE